MQRKEGLPSDSNNVDTKSLETTSLNSNMLRMEQESALLTTISLWKNELVLNCLHEEVKDLIFEEDFN